MPVRTCVGCRAVFEKGSLVRIVARGGTVEVDPTGAAPGRGAYICPSTACIDKAVKSAPWPRALRTSVRPPDKDTLREVIRRAAGERK